MTELGSGTSRQRLARLPMTSGQFVKSLCTIGPAPVQMSGMLSIRSDCVLAVQGLVVFFIDLSFLREQST